LSVVVFDVVENDRRRWLKRDRRWLLIESFWDRELPFFFWIVFVRVPTKVDRLAFDEDRSV